MPFTHATESWGWTTMKKEDDRVMRRISRFLCGLMLGLSFGSVGARADVVLDWNAIAVNTAVANNQSPFAQARYAAIVQLAVFEAVNSITHDYQPYLGTITAPADASPEAAAIEAAYLVLSTYFPASQATLEADRTNSLASIPDGQAKTDGIYTGDAAAAAMTALRASDGSSPPQFKIPGPPVPGEWQATASCPIMKGVAVGVGFQWQNVTPFGIPSAVDFYSLRLRCSPATDTRKPTTR
jgi:hypothetical protein